MAWVESGLRFRGGGSFDRLRMSGVVDGQGMGLDSGFGRNDGYGKVSRTGEGEEEDLGEGGLIAPLPTSRAMLII